MSFVKNLAKAGMFGLAGLAGSSSKDKKKSNTSQSLISGDRSAITSTPSLLSRNGDY